MKKIWTMRLAVFGLSTLVAGGAAVVMLNQQTAIAAQATAAAEPNTLTDAEKAAGFKLLFDGKAIEHWRNYGKQDVSDKWSVKDGTLTLNGKGGDIVTKDQYENFELILEYKISKGGNSGLMFGVQEVKGKPPYDSGPEVQIQDNVDGKDPQKAGWLYQMYQPPVDPKTNKPLDATKPAGEWNQIRFVLNKGKGEIHMNGVEYAKFEVGSEDWNQRLAKSKFAKWENFAKAKKGHICLQDHGNEVSFRNLKIREIAN